MPRSVNKFVIFGGLLCGIANLLAISSLATPSWVVTEFLGWQFLNIIIVHQCECTCIVLYIIIYQHKYIKIVYVYVRW